MSGAGFELHVEAERIRQVLRDPRVAVGQALADAIALLTYAAEQLASIEEIELVRTENEESAQEIQRLRAENIAMRDIVAQLAEAGHQVMQYSGRFGAPPYCSFPGCHYETQFTHTSDCLVKKAEAALMLYPG